MKKKRERIPMGMAALQKHSESSFEAQIKGNPDAFERVDTGYQNKKKEKPVAEYIAHNTGDRQCVHCGGKLKKKIMRTVCRNGKTRVVNGRSKEVRDAEGCLYVIWVCSCQCLSCTKHQRLLPSFAARWMRYALSVIGRVLLHLFENDELARDGCLKPRYGRSWNTVPFYGEMSTVYRWRKNIKIIFGF